MPNSRQASVIVSPSSSLATNRRRSSITEHSFHGRDTSPKDGGKCYPCVLYVLLPMCRVAHRKRLRARRLFLRSISAHGAVPGRTIGDVEHGSDTVSGL